MLLGTLLIEHHVRPSLASRQASAFSPSLVQITFNDEGNRLTAEAVSPKGHLVAYSDRYGISVHALDGGADRLLSSPSSFLAKRISWHPGENWMLVSGFNITSHTNEAWAVFLHGEASRLVLENAAMGVVSPDVSQIAFTRDENRELWLADAIGQNAHVLIPKLDGESFTSLLWSPQGYRLIVDRVSDASADELASSVRINTSPQSAYESFDAHSGKIA